MARAVRTGSQLDTGLLLACAALAALALVMPSHVRASVATFVRRTVLAPLVSVQQRSEIVRSTILSRDSVLQKRAEQVGFKLSAPELANENAQLRKLLGLAARLGHGYVSAEALQTQNFAHDYTLTLSAGSDAGVEPFTPVVTADGIVGMVLSVDPTMSVAISWAHPDFAVSAMSEDESALGIVQPHLGTGAERWLLEMHGVRFGVALKVGARIVSSGIGTTYPAGIPIGTVVGEIQTAEKWSRTYLIKPTVIPDMPGPVLIILPSRRAEGINGVWTKLASADSAAKAIAAAGDSLAQKAALAEIAARNAAQAVADSVAADSAARAEGRVPPARPANPAGVVKPDTGKRPPAKRDSARQRADSVRVRPPAGPPPPDEWQEESPRGAWFDTMQDAAHESMFEQTLPVMSRP